MANTSPEPDDILGTRPTGEGRTGTAQLLRAGLGLLRQHGLRAWLLAVLTLLLLHVITQVVHGPLFIWLLTTQGRADSWWWSLNMLASVASIVARSPVLVAYAFALLLLLKDRRPSLRLLFAPLKSRRLLGNVAIAGSMVPLVRWLLPWLWRSIPWSELQPGIVEEGSLLWRLLQVVPVPEWLTGSLPYWLATMVAVPLAWAGLNALVSRQAWFRSVARSARLAFRYWRLAAGYLVATVLLPFAHDVHTRLGWFAGEHEGAVYWLLFFLHFLSFFVVSSIVILLETLFLVLVYREMIWREREAQSPRFDLAHRPEPVEGPLDSPPQTP